MNAEFVEAVRPAAERVGWTLVHSTWEGAAVAAGLWVVLAVMGGATARGRYAACCAAMVAVVVGMAVTFWVVRGADRVVVRVAGAVPVAVDLRGGVMPGGRGLRDGIVPVRESLDVRGRISPWLPDVAGAWMVGVIGLAAWHFGGWMKVRDGAGRGGGRGWAARAGAVAARMGVRRVVRVVESAVAAVPAVVGFVRPVILLPVGLAAELSVGQVESILAHELAHVRRNDYLVNLVQTVVETLMFYHPAVWWISGRVRQEREHCCDDLAVAACGDRAGYARALARIEEIRDGVPSLAVAADGGSLLNRVRRIVGADAGGGGRGTPLAAVVVASVCAAAAMTAGQWPARAADAPATRPAVTKQDEVGGVKVSSIRPEDLVAEAKDYRIAPNDLLEVGIMDLTGPGVETKKSLRVSQTGKVSLPYVGEQTVADLTTAEAEKRIVKAYEEGRFIHQAQVGVQVAEARGNTFSVIGPGVAHAGEYPITRADLRLAEALAAAGGAGSSSTIRVIRGKGPDQRQIVVTMSALMAGDRAVNLVMRPGDMLFVSEGESKRVHVLVSNDGVTVDGKAGGIEEALRAIPVGDRPHTVVEVGAASGDVPVGTFMDAFGACARVGQELGLPPVSNVGVRHTTAATRPASSVPNQQGAYVVTGKVPRPGAHAFAGASVSLVHAVASAGVAPDDAGYVTVTRQIEGEFARVDYNFSVAEVFKANGIGNSTVLAGDVVTVSAEKLPPAKDSAEAIRPAPHAGEIGEVYMAGHVVQPGIYSVSGRKVTLGQMIASARGLDGSAGGPFADVRRRERPDKEMIMHVSVRRILDGTEPDIYLQPNDEVNVGVPAAAGSAEK